MDTTKPTEGLHTELSLVDAAAFSVGLIGPVGAIGLLIIFAAALIGQQLAGSTVINATFYALQIGTVVILVAYVMATVGAIYFLFFKGKPKAPIWQVVIPALSGAFGCYTIYRNVFVGQVGTYARLPHIEVAYLIVGLVVVCVAPGLAGRVRAGLAAGSVP